MIVTKYDISTGEITGVLQGAKSAVMENISVGEGFIEGSFDGEKFYVENGAIVSKSNPPSKFHTFDPVTKLWSITDAGVSAMKYDRERLLQETDWTQLPDVPEATRLKWQAYRQALRDITDQPGFPENVVWPELPQ